MCIPRPTHVRLRRLTITAGVVVAAIGGLSACSGETAGASSTPAASTPTASAEFVPPSAPSSSTTATVSAADTTAAPTDQSGPADTSATVPTDTPTPVAVTSPTVLPEVTAPTDPQEIAGRQAVEAAWTRFWDYYPTFEELSPAERQEIADAIAVDPLKSQILQGAANADAGGRTGYGTVTHRISWFQSLNSQSNIVIADCMDQSQMGSMNKASGKKLTHGFPREDLKGQLAFDPDRGWRVQNLFYVQDAPPC